MDERVLSVNVGRTTPVPYRGKLVATGIFKAPVEGRIAVRRTNLDGDEQADPSVHGGEDKAVYLYSWDSYEWWIEQLGHPLQPGEFGENLTVTGLTDDLVRVGDRFRAGAALLEATGPREPCFKLGIRMGDPTFVERFLHADRMGFYARVIEEGDVAAGDTIERASSAPDPVTIAEIHRLFADARDDLPALRRAVAVPALPESWRGWFEKQIARVGAAPSAPREGRTHGR